MSKNNKEINSKEINENKSILNIKRKRNKEKDNLDNIIIGNIRIKKDDLKQKIINSVIDDVLKKNEKEKKICEIFINDKKIKFSYYYKFPKEGNYIIKYKFKKLLNLLYLIEKNYLVNKYTFF